MGLQCKSMCHMSYKYNFAMIISDSQQKYVVLKAMRRSNGTTKNLLIKKFKSKVYISFQISLYNDICFRVSNVVAVHNNLLTQWRPI